MRINLAAWLPRSEVNGPGVRAVIWVQGCPLPLCRGCFNPAFLALDRVVEWISPEALAERVLAVDGLRGVTFSGGEPFHQARPLALTARLLRERGLDVVVFTGHTLESLRSGAVPGALELLEQVDLLVAGPYRDTEPCDEPLRSSLNQRLHFLGRITAAELAPPAPVEITIDADGELQLTGFPAKELAGSLRR